MRKPRAACCHMCGVALTSHHTNRKWCSERCRHAAAGRMPLEWSIWIRECRYCGSLFCGRFDNAVYCSKRCRNARAGSYDKARRRLARPAEIENFTLREIAERDGWRCHLCGGKVTDRKWSARDSDPTLDHLLPISKGGMHTRDNVALAHNRCNWERKDALIEFQPRLIA